MEGSIALRHVDDVGQGVVADDVGVHGTLEGGVRGTANQSFANRLRKVLLVGVSEVSFTATYQSGSRTPSSGSGAVGRVVGDQGDGHMGQAQCSQA